MPASYVSTKLSFVIAEPICFMFLSYFKIKIFFLNGNVF